MEDYFFEFLLSSIRNSSKGRGRGLLSSRVGIGGGFFVAVSFGILEAGRPVLSGVVESFVVLQVSKEGYLSSIGASASS